MDYNVNGIQIECEKKADSLGAVSLYCNALSKIPVPEQKNEEYEQEEIE